MVCFTAPLANPRIWKLSIAWKRLLLIFTLSVLLVPCFLVTLMSILTRDPRRKSYFNKLTAISDIFGLQQLVSDYTRTPDFGSPSIIDLVFTSSAVQVFDIQVTEKLATSDHHMVTFSRGKSQRSQNLRKTFNQYHRADVEQLNNLILNTDWNNIFHDDWPIDRVLDTFTETFFCHINQCIPKVTKRRKFNGWQLAKMKKSIPDMSMPWNL